MDDFDYDSFYNQYMPEGDWGDVDTSGLFFPDDPYDTRFGRYTDPESTQPDGGLGGAPGSRTDLPFFDTGGSGGLSALASALKSLLRPSGQGGILGSGVGILPLLMGLMARNSRPGASGGGYTGAYQGPQKFNRRVVQSKYGPVVKYAEGGPVHIQDGGFVMTKRAVDGAGGPQGIQKLIPGAQHILGPGTGTSDDIPAVIVGKQGTTPAALSNGEAYVPPAQVQSMGGAQRLYSLMNNLQKRG